MKKYYVLFTMDDNGKEIPFAYSKDLGVLEEYSKKRIISDVQRIGHHALIALKSAHFIINLDK